MTSLYDISIPVLNNILKSTIEILKKGEQYADKRNIPARQFLGAAIYEDMLPLVNQVLFLCHIQKIFIHKFADGTAPEMQDAIAKQDRSFEELYQLINDAVCGLERINRANLDGKEDERIIFQVGSRWVKKSTGAEFVQSYILPHSFFHTSMTYAILRQQGVPLGKLDYITNFVERLTDA